MRSIPVRIFDASGHRLRGHAIRGFLEVTQRLNLQGLNEAGVLHRIVQAEGGEQGDPLMPMLFSLADPRPVGKASRELSDVCSHQTSQTEPHSVRQSQREAVNARRASVCPVEMVEFGPDVWNPEGVKVLGTPVQWVRERSCGHQQATDGKAQSCMGPRPPVSVTNAHPIRRLEMPPHPPDVHPTQSTDYANGVMSG